MTLSAEIYGCHIDYSIKIIIIYAKENYYVTIQK